MDWNKDNQDRFFALFLISDAADLLPKMKAEVRLSAPSFERLPEPPNMIVHKPHSPTIPVIMENTVDNIPILEVLYAEKDIRSDAPVIGVSSGWENWRRPGSSVSWIVYKAPGGVFTNTPSDTPNNRIPNWNARKASNGVRSVRGSPVMKIKSLGDITNNPARASSKANVATDQAVMVPSASSESIVAVDGAAFRGPPDIS